MSDLAQEGVQVAIDYRPSCFEAGHTCTNNICYDCSGVAARELVAEKTAALRAALGSTGRRLHDEFHEGFFERCQWGACPEVRALLSTPYI